MLVTLPEGLVSTTRYSPSLFVLAFCRSSASFVALHQARYGFTLDAPVEVVSLRHVAEGVGRPVRFSRPKPTAGSREPKAFKGPASLALSDATLYVAPGWSAKLDAHGHWILTRSSKK